MAISKRVQTQLSRVVPSGESQSSSASHRGGTYQQSESGPVLVQAPIATSASCIPEQIPSRHHDTSSNSTTTNSSSKGKVWTMEEHERFVQAIQLFPAGPWKAIAAVVGSKTPRQAMSHAQKCRQKQERWQRGLKIQSRRSGGVSRQPFISAPNASNNSNGSRLIQSPPVEEIRCNAMHNAPVDRFSVCPMLINEERTVKSHVTSVYVGDATRLTQYWHDVHGRPLDLQQQGRHHHHNHHLSLASALETVPVFPVFGVFETPGDPAIMWPPPISSSSSVSTMRLPIAPVAEDSEAREALLHLFQPNDN